MFETQGLPAFLQAAKSGDAFSAVQLGIFYKNGLYVPKDTQFAQAIFDKAFKMDDTPENILAKAYMYKNGLGINKDSQKAYTLFAQARPHVTGNVEFVDRLFAKDNTLDFVEMVPDLPFKLPLLKSVLPLPLLPQQIEIKESLEIEPIEIKKIEPVTKPPLPVVKVENPASKQLLPTPIPQSVIYKTLLDRCNTLSQPHDGSFLELDHLKKQILIHDPQYKNEFMVPYEESEFNPRVNLVLLRYDDRIKQWFTKSIKALKSDPETSWKIPSHRFGTAVDCLMQLIGIKNPILGHAKNQLMHSAESLTQKNKGHFEYTFKKEGTKNIVYHRMYRAQGENGKIKKP